MAGDATVEHISALLARLRVFPLADFDLIRELASICSYLSVPGGSLVIVEGEESDAIYLVVTGIFGAYRQAADGREILLDRMGVGEIIGELGVITGEARMATVKALRNSELLRISKEDLYAVASRCPDVLLAICRTVVQRLQHAQQSPVTRFRPRTFCLLPGDSATDSQSIIAEIAASLGSFGRVMAVSAEKASGQTSGWFSELEHEFDYLLFRADDTPTAWTRFCLRQCDCIVLLARGDAEPVDFAALGPGRIHVPKNIPFDLMLRWRDKIEPSKTTAWLEVAKPRAHYHARSPSDIARAARLVAGRGTGLVLSGGGARGLAHVGVIEALKGHGIDIDVIGGTSIGAVVAAFAALEWDLAPMARSFAGEFARQRISDFDIPRVALYSERKFARTLGRWFGEIRIEDAPIPFFCVTSNLTDGVANMHRAGRFATWLRATTAIPGVFPPVIEDDIVHVDGGVLDNLPTGFVRELGASFVIAVDVGSTDGPWRFGRENGAKPSGQTRMPSMPELLWRVGTIGSGPVAGAVRRDCNVVLRPDVAGVGMFGWRACEQAIEAGYRVALEHLREIEAAIGKAD